MWAPADVRSPYSLVRCDTRATLLCWASKKELRSLDNERPTCRLSSGATLPLLAGIFIPAEAHCTAFEKRSFCPNAARSPTTGAPLSYPPTPSFYLLQLFITCRNPLQQPFVLLPFDCPAEAHQCSNSSHQFPHGRHSPTAFRFLRPQRHSWPSVGRMPLSPALRQ